MSNKPLLLIAEDDPLMRDTIEYSLHQHFTCVCVESIKAARDVIENNVLACVVLDMKFPDGEGTEVIPLITKKKIPLVIVTGYSSHYIGNEMILHYQKNIVEKPFRAEVLRDAVLNVVKGH